MVSFATKQRELCERTRSVSIRAEKSEKRTTRLSEFGKSVAASTPSCSSHNGTWDVCDGWEQRECIGQEVKKSRRSLLAVKVFNMEFIKIVPRVNNVLPDSVNYPVVRRDWLQRYFKKLDVDTSKVTKLNVNEDDIDSRALEENCQRGKSTQFRPPSSTSTKTKRTSQRNPGGRPRKKMTKNDPDYALSHYHKHKMLLEHKSTKHHDLFRRYRMQNAYSNKSSLRIAAKKKDPNAKHNLERKMRGNSSSLSNQADCDAEDYDSLDDLPLSLRAVNCKSGSRSDGSDSFDRLLSRVLSSKGVLERHDAVEVKLPSKQQCRAEELSTLLQEQDAVQTEEYFHSDVNPRVLIQKLLSKDFGHVSKKMAPHLRDNPNEPKTRNTREDPSSVESTLATDPSGFSTSTDFIIQDVSMKQDLMKELLYTLQSDEANLSADLISDECEAQASVLVDSTEEISMEEHAEASTSADNSSPVDEIEIPRGFSQQVSIEQDTIQTHMLDSSTSIEKDLSIKCPNETVVAPTISAPAKEVTVSMEEKINCTETSSISHVVANLFNESTKFLSKTLGPELFAEFYDEFQDRFVLPPTDAVVNKEISKSTVVSPILIDLTNDEEVIKVERNSDNEPEGSGSQDTCDERIDSRSRLLHAYSDFTNILKELSAGEEYAKNSMLVAEKNTEMLGMIAGMEKTVESDLGEAKDLNEQEASESGVAIGASGNNESDLDLVQNESNKTSDIDNSTEIEIILDETSIECVIEVEEINFDEGHEATAMEWLPARNTRDMQSIACTSTAHRETDEGDLCNLGSLLQEPSAMIDATRISNSLATALRDRPTGIPVQPNRSLPLRPAPPAPTRILLIKSPKSSPVVKFANAASTTNKDEKSKDSECSDNSAGNLAKEHAENVQANFYRSEGRAMGRETVNRTFPKGSNKRESPDEYDSSRIGWSKKRRSSSEHKETDHGEISARRMVSDSDWAFAGQDESLSKSSEGTFLIGNERSQKSKNNERHSPKGGTGEDSSSNNSMMEDERSQMNVQRPINGETKENGDNLGTIRWELKQTKEHHYELNPTIESQSGLRSNFYTEASPMLLNESTTASVSNSAEDNESGKIAKTVSTIGVSSETEMANTEPPSNTADGGRSEAMNESSSQKPTIQTTIPLCPSTIPISLARRYNTQVPMKSKTGARSKRFFGTSKNKKKAISHFPSMPVLEEDTDVGSRFVSATMDGNSSTDTTLIANGKRPCLADESEELETLLVNQSSSQAALRKVEGAKRTLEPVYTVVQQVGQLVDQSTTVDSIQRKADQLLTALSSTKSIDSSPIRIQIPEYPPVFNLPRRTSISEVGNGTPSPLPLSPRIQEALNQHKRQQEQEKIETERRRMAIIEEENARELEDRRLQESLIANFRAQAAVAGVKEAAKLQKKARQKICLEGKLNENGTICTGETVQDLNHDTLSEDLSRRPQAVVIEQRKALLDKHTNGQIIRGDLQNSQDQAKDPGIDLHEPSTTASTTSKLRPFRKDLKSSQRVRVQGSRNDRDRLKLRCQKLSCRLQELQREATNLQQQMLSTEDPSQRARLQQQLNCLERHVENTRKNLNKHASREIARCYKQSKDSVPSFIMVRQNLGQTIPSPDPPILSPNINSSASSRSFPIRNSPPILPRVGLTIPDNLASPPNNLGQVRRTSNAEVSPTWRVADQIELAKRFEVPSNPSSPKSPNSNGQYSKTSLAEPFSSLSPSVDIMVLNPTNRMPSIPGNNNNSNNQQQRQTVDPMPLAVVTEDPTVVSYLNYSAGSQNGSMVTVRTMENGCSVNNAMNTNRANNATLSASPVPAIPHAHPTANEAFHHPVHLTDYGRMGTQNMLSRDNGGANINLLSPLQAHSALALPGSHCRPLEAQLPQRLNQHGGEPVMSYTVDQDGTLIPSTPVSQSQSQAQLAETFPESIRPARPKNNNATEATQHRLMSEQFPTFGNWVEQMATTKSKRGRPRKNAAASSSTSQPSDFHVPGSDMYKMSATAVDLHHPTTVNSRPEWHDQHLCQGFYAQQNLPPLYPDYRMNSYGRTMGYHPMYSYASYQYHQMHEESLDTHRMHSAPMNTQGIQHPAHHPLPHSMQHYATGMLAHSTMPVSSYQNQINNANLRNSTEALQIEYLGVPPSAISSATSRNYPSAQFRMPDRPSVVQSGQLNQSTRLKHNFLTTPLATNPSAQLDRNLLSAQLLNNSSTHIDNQNRTSSKNEPPIEILDLTRNCETPNLGRVQQSPNTLNELKCSNCGFSGPMFNCLGCEMSFYCSESCQVQHWEVHVTDCSKRMPKLKKI